VLPPSLLLLLLLLLWHSCQVFLQAVVGDSQQAWGDSGYEHSMAE
jgi:hypothetical protein